MPPEGPQAGGRGALSGRGGPENGVGVYQDGFGQRRGEVPGNWPTG
jgi:hypothetical protein